MRTALHGWVHGVMRYDFVAALAFGHDMVMVMGIGRGMEWDSVWKGIHMA